ncbi:MAG: hypothetical protein PSN35_01775, partial [Candidatus Thioglobus sp.]|nr:hypothetical protein [Candidatus Thioglobus sp.]
VGTEIPTKPSLPEFVANLALFWCFDDFETAPSIINQHNETPIVFKSPLYATAAWLGSLGFIALVYYEVGIALSAIIAGLCIFVTRLIAIRLDLGLPKFQLKE